MPQKKTDILILTLLGFLLGGVLLVTVLPIRDKVVPTFSRNFYVHLYYFFLLLGGINILAGLGLKMVRDDTLKKLGTLTWLLEMAVAGFVFISIFILRLDWGILPFYAGLRQPYISLRILPAVAIFLVGVLYLSKRKNKRLSGGDLAVLVVFSFLLNMAVVAINPSFVTGISRTFSRTAIEYYGDISQVDHQFLFHYVDKMPQLSLHGKTHPPLAALFLWVLTRMGVGIFGASIATAIFGSLTLVFVYYIACDLFGEEAGRISALIFWLVPAVVLYSAVSMDILFMFLCTVTVYCFQRALHKVHYALLCAFSFSLALFSTFVAGFLFLVFLIWIALGHIRGSLPAMAYRNLAWAGGFIVIIHLALYWGLNYNVIEVFLSARHLNVVMMTGPRARPYGYWVAGNLVEYFTFLGLPMFSMVCLYGWSLKKKFPHTIFPLLRLYVPYLSLISPAS